MVVGKKFRGSFEKVCAAYVRDRLEGRTDIDTIAGDEHTVPAHATVIILGLSPVLAQLTITAGTGYSIFPGFQNCFPITTSIP